MVRPLFAIALALSAAPAIAQQQSPPAPGASDEERAIVVQAQRKKLVRTLQALIQTADNDQLARFEDSICPRVIGMPADWSQMMTKMIRDNVAAAGGQVGRVGCKANTLAIFNDQPRELIGALHSIAPGYFDMEPGEFRRFSKLTGPVWSWHITDLQTRDGVSLTKTSEGIGTVPYSTPGRLYTNVRQNMVLGVVMIDRQKTVGATLRQLADLATMHLLLDVKQGAMANDNGSILSLFTAGADAPPRMSAIDRGAITGFYTQRKNNLTAVQQRINIANAIKKGAGSESVAKR